MTGTRSRTGASSSERRGSARLGRAFFARATARVARALLGAHLRVRTATGIREARLVETEAYVRHDAASHAFHGPTRRNRSMFEAPGTLYVFRIHQVVCANLVTRPGEAVLLRAGAMRGARPGEATGPGRLCRALGITIEDDGEDAVAGRRFAVAPRRERPRRVVVGPRVGV
ncbi:MAG: DNA-3-methyladenine glycosylase, partial [Thermoplasmata archaeon]